VLVRIHMGHPTAHARLPRRRACGSTTRGTASGNPDVVKSQRKKLPRLSESRRWPNLLADSAFLMCRMVLWKDRRLDPRRSLIVHPTEFMGACLVRYVYLQVLLADYVSQLLGRMHAQTQQAPVKIA
jgi:hypothetical protein